METIRWGDNLPLESFEDVSIPVTNNLDGKDYQMGKNELAEVALLGTAQGTSIATKKDVQGNTEKITANKQDINNLISGDAKSGHAVIADTLTPGATMGSENVTTKEDVSKNYVHKTDNLQETITGKKTFENGVDIKGGLSDKPLQVMNVVGSNGQSELPNKLYLNYGTDKPVCFGADGTTTIDKNVFSGDASGLVAGSKMGGFDISTHNDTYTKDETLNTQEIQDLLSTVYTYKGSVPTYADLPKDEPPGTLKVGDVYNVEDTGLNWAWDGSDWDELGMNVDVSLYATKEELENGSVVPMVSANANNLGDIPADRYALKTDVPNIKVLNAENADKATSDPSGKPLAARNSDTYMADGGLGVWNDTEKRFDTTKTPTLDSVTATNVTTDTATIGSADVTGQLKAGGPVAFAGDKITLRDGTNETSVPIPEGGFSGLSIENYDGTKTNMNLVVDNKGTARLGKDTSLEPLLTRKEVSEMQDQSVVIWDSPTKSAKTITVPEGSKGKVLVYNGTDENGNNLPPSFEKYKTAASWVGTKDEFIDAKAQTDPDADNYLTNGQIVNIVDDGFYTDNVSSEPREGDYNPISSDAVAKVVNGTTPVTKVADGTVMSKESGDEALVTLKDAFTLYTNKDLTNADDLNKLDVGVYSILGENPAHMPEGAFPYARVTTYTYREANQDEKYQLYESLSNDKKWFRTKTNTRQWNDWKEIATDKNAVMLYAKELDVNDDVNKLEPGTYCFYEKSIPKGDLPENSGFCRIEDKSFSPIGITKLQTLTDLVYDKTWTRRYDNGPYETGWTKWKQILKSNDAPLMLPNKTLTADDDLDNLHSEKDLGTYTVFRVYPHNVPVGSSAYARVEIYTYNKESLEKGEVYQTYEDIIDNRKWERTYIESRGWSDWIEWYSSKNAVSKALFDAIPMSTDIRNFTWDQWNNDYGKIGHTELWVRCDHMERYAKGQLVTISGTVSDAKNIRATIWIRIKSIDSAASFYGTTEYLRFEGNV